MPNPEQKVWFKHGSMAYPLNVPHLCYLNDEGGNINPCGNGRNGCTHNLKPCSGGNLSSIGGKKLSKNLKELTTNKKWFWRIMSLS